MLLDDGSVAHGGCHGMLDVLRMGLALLSDKQAHDALLRSNFEGILGLLSRDAIEERFAGREQELLDGMQRYERTVTAKRLAKLERAYHAEQQAREAEDSEVERLRRQLRSATAEAKSLRAELARANLELDTIAAKLVEKTMALNEAETECDELRRRAAPLPDGEDTRADCSVFT